MPLRTPSLAQGKALASALGRVDGHASEEVWEFGKPSASKEDIFFGCRGLVVYCLFVQRMSGFGPSAAPAPNRTSAADCWRR